VPTPDSLGTIVVTGGSSGLGAAVAQLVADRGGTPVVVDLKPPPAGHAFVQADLSDGRAAERAMQQVADEHGGIDGLVTAAGIDFPGTIDDIDAERWERVVAVNLVGTAAAVRGALPHLRASEHGRVVTVGSTLSYSAVSDATAYCASKFGVIGFSRALAVELAGQVGVTCLVPGGMHTHFFDDRPAQYKPGPDANLNRPEDTAAAVLFALQQPPGCEVRELVVANALEGSWPP
jgi:NAD(P)-dependent dehydrogenase (short-subunit alcohol dehydrogenase family)